MISSERRSKRLLKFSLSFCFFMVWSSEEIIFLQIFSDLEENN